MHKVRGGGAPWRILCPTLVVVPGITEEDKGMTVYIITIIGDLPCAQKCTLKVTVDTRRGAATIALQKGA